MKKKWKKKAHRGKKLKTPAFQRRFDSVSAENWSSHFPFKVVAAFGFGFSFSGVLWNSHFMYTRSRGILIFFMACKLRPTFNYSSSASEGRRCKWRKKTITVQQIFGGLFNQVSKLAWKLKPALYVHILNNCMLILSYFEIDYLM